MSLLLTRRQAVQAVGLTAFGFALPASAADQNPFRAARVGRGGEEGR